MALAALLIVGLGGAVTAAVVNVEFQNKNGNASITYSGSGAIAAPGTIWNAVTPSQNVNFDEGWGQLTFSGTDPVVWPNWPATPVGLTSGALVDSQGNATGMTVTASAWFVYAAPNPTVSMATGYSDLMREYLDTETTVTGIGTVTLNGLTANAPYKLALYGHGADPYRNTTFTVGGVDKSTSYVDFTHSLTENVDYVVYQNVIADANGKIAINYGAGGALQNGMSGAVNTEGSFNGLQIQSVPEPAALSLLALGALAILSRRRKSGIKAEIN